MNTLAIRAVARTSFFIFGAGSSASRPRSHRAGRGGGCAAERARGERGARADAGPARDPQSASRRLRPPDSVSKEGRPRGSPIGEASNLKQAIAAFHAPLGLRRVRQDQLAPQMFHRTAQLRLRNLGLQFLIDPSLPCALAILPSASWGHFHGIATTRAVSA